MQHSLLILPFPGTADAPREPSSAPASITSEITSLLPQCPGRKRLQKSSPNLLELGTLQGKIMPESKFPISCPRAIAEEGEVFQALAPAPGAAAGRGLACQLSCLTCCSEPTLTYKSSISVSPQSFHRGKFPG